MTRPALTLVVSRPPDTVPMRPGSELCHAVAGSVADAVGLECARLGRSATLEDVVGHVMDRRGISDLETLAWISCWALKALATREAAAIERHRRPRPPRRPRSRVPEPVQLRLPFSEWRAA